MEAQIENQEVETSEAPERIFGMASGTLSGACMACVDSEPGISLPALARAIDEPINLVSGILKYLINKGHLTREKGENPMYSYRIALRHR